MNYNINYSKRKTISIRIIDENNIKVSAPIGVSKEKVNAFISSKQKWINNKINQILKIKNAFNDVIYGNKLIVLGKFVVVNEDKTKLLTKLAGEYLLSRVKYLSNLYNFNCNNVNVKNYKSKWGQCDRQGNITLNIKLMMLSKETIDYVIMHELCHTLYLNHQKSFHKKLSSFYKNETPYKKELKEYSVLLKYKI